MKVRDTYLLVETRYFRHGHRDPFQQALRPRQSSSEGGEVVRDRWIVLVLREQLLKATTTQHKGERKY